MNGACWGRRAGVRAETRGAQDPEGALALEEAFHSWPGPRWSGQRYVINARAQARASWAATERRTASTNVNIPEVPTPVPFPPPRSPRLGCGFLRLRLRLRLRPPLRRHRPEQGFSY